MEEMTASSGSPKTFTRSGAVRKSLNKKVGYLSSQPEDDETLQDFFNLSLESDDEEIQSKDSNEDPNWSPRKPRHSSHGSSRSSISTGSTLQLKTTLIYLDLEPSVATIMHEPFADLFLDNDADLKTKILKFLGLIPRRRKLYNPGEHLYLESKETSHKEAAPSRCFLKITSTSAEPDSTKAQIDLSELPSEKWRASNCRQHKDCIACLEVRPLLYSFVDSLNPAAAIKLCHPQALTYRQSDFNSCKQELAKLLFNIFNHAIFHCALQLDIVWKGRLDKPCRCEMTIDSFGQRSARLLLRENNMHPGNLIKPLLHEMCHAAAFIFNRETGHGDTCRQWAFQANQQLTELTLIEDCNSRFKYVCSMCGRGSYGLMDFAVNKEMLRCFYCQFEVVVEPLTISHLYDGIRPDTKMTAFKTFIFDKYQQLAEQEVGISHSFKMRFLNQQYLDMKLQAACD